MTATNYSKQEILDAICWVESKWGTTKLSLYPHQYCVQSWGYFGITQQAVDEIVRTCGGGPRIPVHQACGPHTPMEDQRMLADAYLQLVYDRLPNNLPKDWFAAALVYHAGVDAVVSYYHHGNSQRVAEYARRLEDALKKKPWRSLKQKGNRNKQKQN